MVDYEHIPFRCRKCHEHGNLYRDYPTNNMERNVKTTTDKNPKGFTKVGGKGKAGSGHKRRSMRKGNRATIALRS